MTSKAQDPVHCARKTILGGISLTHHIETLKNSMGKRFSTSKKFETKRSTRFDAGIDVREARKRANKTPNDETFALIEFEKGNSDASLKNYHDAMGYYLETLAHTSNKKLLQHVYFAIIDVCMIVMKLAESNEDEKQGYGNSAIVSLEDAIDLISKEDPDDHRIISLRYKLGNVLFAVGRNDDAYLQYSIVVENPIFKINPDSVPKEPAARTSEDEGKKIDFSATQEDSFEEWKDIFIYKLGKKKKLPFYVEEETLGQMMYNYAMLQLNDKLYSVATSFLLDVYRYKILSRDSIPHIPEFAIIYYLGMSYLFSDQKYWAAVLLETFLRKFDHDHANAEDYDDGFVHILLGGIYVHICNDLALMHDFAYISGVMGLKIRNPRKLIQLSIKKFKDEGQVVIIFKRMGYIFLERGDYHIAAHILRDIYEVLEATEENPQELLELLKKNYICYDGLDIGETLDGEIWVLRELVERMERMIGAGYDLSTDELAAYSNELGEMLMKKKHEYQDSVIYLNKFLKFAKPDNPSIVNAKNMIARIYYILGDMDKALATCIDAIKSAMYLKDDDVRVNILCMKGSIHARKNQRREFIGAFQEALELKRCILGQNQLHQDVANILYLYGTVFYYLGNYKECVDCFLEAFSILVLYDDLKNKCIEVLDGAVRGYRQMKFYNSALATCKKILDLQPTLSEKTASTFELMGDIHFERGGWSNHVNAAELYREAVCVLRRYHHSHSEQVLNLYEKMASMQMYLDENDMSMKTFKFVVKSHKVSHNGERPMVALEALEGQGDIYFQRGQYSMALQRYEKTINYIQKLETKSMGSIQREKLKDLRIILLLKIGRTQSRTMDYVKALQSLSTGFSNLSSENKKKFLRSVISCHFLYELGLACIGMGDDNLAKDNFQKAAMLLQLVPDLGEDGEELKMNIDKEIRALKKTNCMTSNCEMCNLTKAVAMVPSRQPLSLTNE